MKKCIYNFLKRVAIYFDGYNYVLHDKVVYAIAKVINVEQDGFEKFNITDVDVKMTKKNGLVIVVSSHTPNVFNDTIMEKICRIAKEDTEIDDEVNISIQQEMLFVFPTSFITGEAIIE